MIYAQFAMLDNNINCLSWNPRGLNCSKWCDVVGDLFASSSCQIVYLQETKLHHVNAFTAAHMCGHRLCNFLQRLANGTKGGILMLWDNVAVQVANVTAGHHHHSWDGHRLQDHHGIRANSEGT
jgi:hypothetical protein